MASPAERMARSRERRRQLGLLEATIWISPEAEALVNSAIAAAKAKDRSEVVEYALRQCFQLTEGKLMNAVWSGRIPPGVA